MYLFLGIVILAVCAWRVARDLLFLEGLSEERDWAGNVFRAGATWRVIVEIVFAVVGLALIILSLLGVLQ